jgi:hypothetical protein
VIGIDFCSVSSLDSRSIPVYPDSTRLGVFKFHTALISSPVHIGKKTETMVNSRGVKMVFNIRGKGLLVMSRRIVLSTIITGTSRSH